jgi:hypothetical protein
MRGTDTGIAWRGTVRAVAPEISRDVRRMGEISGAADNGEEMRAPDRRYVLAFADDAPAVADAEGVTVIARLPMVVLVETDIDKAFDLAKAGEYVAVYDSSDDALRAFSVFTG